MLTVEIEREGKYDIYCPDGISGVSDGGKKQVLSGGGNGPLGFDGELLCGKVLCKRSSILGKKKKKRILD